MSAAAAVTAALEAQPGVRVKNVDVLTLANSAFRHLYGKLYLDLIDRAPLVLGYLYDLLDRPDRRTSAVGARLRLAAEKMNLRPLIALLKEEPWDAVVSTHFLPAEILAHLRKSKKTRVPHVTVTTDFYTHRLWVNEPCDHYFTARPDGADYLIHLGVPPERITVSGIPVHPKFAARPRREDARRRHGLPLDRPVVLQLAGGFGVGPIEEIYRALLSLPQPVGVVAVTGRNEKTRASLSKVPVPARHHALVIGFTTEVHELMSAADAVVSKPGGLTTAEALACGTPLIVVNPVPGQESQNSDFLLENGAAVKIQKIATLAAKVASVLFDKTRLSSMRENAARLGRPGAAFDVARATLAMIGHIH
jgi:processive 1,2-diacylglycerol beta-glucosyltransferase